MVEHPNSVFLLSLRSSVKQLGNTRKMIPVVSTEVTPLQLKHNFLEVEGEYIIPTTNHV